MPEQFEQDDREVLLRAMAKRVHNREVGVFAGHDDFGTCASCEESVTAVLAAGYRKVEVTDGMVERAFGAIRLVTIVPASWASSDAEAEQVLRDAVRAALEAARGGE